MALKILQPGCQPLGQFDGYDSQVLLLKGGEVVTFTSVAVTSTDLAAVDVYDGYVNPSGVQKRTMVTNTLINGNRPLMLADEGIAGYGTLFGTVIGGTVGKNTSGTVLGPSTATGSGKVTLWSKPGLYAVSLDACDTNATTGLQPTNPTITTGSALYATAAGLLTHGGASFEAVVVARFVEFESNGSLVNTPNRLVRSMSTSLGQFAYAVFHWNPPIS
jgi:hypothetical protein